MPLTWRAPKDPDEILDFGIDWETALGEDTIVASTWDVPSGLMKESDTFDDTSTTIVLSGGVLGTSYNLTNYVTTAGGNYRERTVKLKMKEK